MIRFSLSDNRALCSLSGFYESGIKNIGHFWENNNDKAYKEHPHFGKSPPADEYDALFETTYALLYNY